MIAAVDVSYHTDRTIAAGVLFPDWTSDTPVAQVCRRLPRALTYEPGRFYRRELPGILQVLDKLKNRFDTVVIDGYVWLASRKAGLGGHLYMALGGRVPVVGVAKSEFKGAVHAQQVFRGRSHRPLFVTAAGMDVLIAASHVRSMHGPHRIPSMLKLVDRICRLDDHAGSGDAMDLTPMEGSAMTDAGKPSLSLRSLRVLHRHLDDVALTIKVKSGEMAAVELERALRRTGAETDEIERVLADYRRLRQT